MPTRRRTVSTGTFHYTHYRSSRNVPIGNENIHLEAPTEFRCHECDNIHPMNKLKNHDGKDYCLECFENLYRFCSDCDTHQLIEDGVTRGTGIGTWICGECFDDHYFTCDSCGDIYYDDDQRGYDGEIYCCDCYDERYVRCASCDHVMEQDESQYYENSCGTRRAYCDDCYEEATTQDEIKSWRYKPTPVFKKIQRQAKTKLYYGIELEIDCGSGNGKDAKKIKEQAPEDIYIKHDGSLNSGMEIVSHPASYRYHFERLNWKGLLEKSKELGYKSHDTSTCGIHIHVSKKFFGKNAKERDASIMKVLYLTQTMIWPKLKKFSRRNNKNSMDSYARRFQDLYDPMQLLYEAKHSERHRNINIHPDQTIEFRFFRGTLKLNTFLANIQFIRIISEFATALDISDIKKIEWGDIVVYAEDNGFKEFIKFVKERKIYDKPRMY